MLPGRQHHEYETRLYAAPPPAGPEKLFCKTAALPVPPQDSLYSSKAAPRTWCSGRVPKTRIGAVQVFMDSPGFYLSMPGIG